MKKNLMVAMAAASALALPGCGGGEERQGGLTSEESRELDNAADMLDTSPDSLIAPDNMMLGNGEDAGGEEIAEEPVNGQ